MFTLWSPQNDQGLVPADVVPDPMDMSLDKAEAAMVAKELRQRLLDAVPLSCSLPRATLPNYDNVPGNLMLSSLGLKLGDRVQLDEAKVRGHTRGGRPAAVRAVSNAGVLCPRRAPCGSAGPPSSPAASGWAWSWTSRWGRTTAAWAACATSSAPPSWVTWKRPALAVSG